jgi:hypothetical protein
MKGFTKDGKFRPTGNRTKSSLKKSDVRKKETVSSTGADKLKSQHSEFYDEIKTEKKFDLQKEDDDGWKTYIVTEKEVGEEDDAFEEMWFEIRNDKLENIYDDPETLRMMKEHVPKLHFPFTDKGEMELKYYIEGEMRNAERENKEKEWEEQGLVSWDEIDDGDLIDFGSYGKLYLVNKHFQSHHDDQPQVRVTDLKDERYNKHASGWNMNLHDSAGFKVLEKANENDREYARGEEQD